MSTSVYNALLRSHQKNIPIDETVRYYKERQPEYFQNLKSFSADKYVALKLLEQDAQGQLNREQQKSLQRNIDKYYDRATSATYGNMGGGHVEASNVQGQARFYAQTQSKEYQEISKTQDIIDSAPTLEDAKQQIMADDSIRSSVKVRAADQINQQIQKEASVSSPVVFVQPSPTVANNYQSPEPATVSSVKTPVVTVAVDKSAIADFQRQAEKAGVGTVGELFSAVKGVQAKTSDVVKQSTTTPVQYTSTYSAATKPSFVEQVKARVVDPVVDRYQSTFTRPLAEFKEGVVRQTGDKPTSVGGIVALASANALQVVGDPVRTVGNIAKNIISLPGYVFDKGKQLITLSAATNPLRAGAYVATTTAEELTAAAITNPAEFALTTKALSKTTKLPAKAKDVYVAARSKTYIPPEQVFSPDVLSGKNTFPTTSSTAQSISKFQEAKGVVQTSGPTGLKGTTTGAGGRATAGLEDPGVYVTPAKQGSPYFLEVQKTGSQYSLNPLDALDLRRGVPTVTRFSGTQVVRYPENVINEPGFSALKAYQEANVGKGNVYITKRSTIGQGEIAPKRYTDAKGATKIEGGTVEIEGVIGVGESFQYRSGAPLSRVKYDAYTKYEGRNIAIRDAELVRGGVPGSAPGISTLTGRELLRESSAYSRVVSGVKSPYDPILGTYGALATAARGSSTSQSSVSKSLANLSVPNQQVSYQIQYPSISQSTIALGGSNDINVRPVIVSSGSSSRARSSEISSVGGLSGTSGGGSSSSDVVVPPVPPDVPAYRPPTPVDDSYISPSGDDYRPVFGGGSSRGSSRERKPVTQTYYNPSPGSPSSIFSPGGSVYSSANKSRRNDGYLSFARIRGRFSLVGRGSTKEEAFRAGSTFVENNPAATTKITGLGGGKGLDFQGGSRGLKKKKTDDEGYLFIEPSKRRISTAGELQQITFEGVRASKKQSRSKSIWRIK